MPEPRLTAEILSTVRALTQTRDLGEVVAEADLVRVKRDLLDLSARERRELAREGVLVDDGRRQWWVFAVR